MKKTKENQVRKPTKTISGITPVAIMLPPRKCDHGACTFCPNMDVPQSYTPKSPVVLRASRVNYDSYKQVKTRIEAFESMNHPTEKIELIIMGGTFLQYPKKFQYEFIKGCYDALNEKKSKNLQEAKKLNEQSNKRCVALCIETRPDTIVKYIQRLREFGATRVELGVQIIDDEIYEKVNRGHGVKDVIKATKALKDYGFKIGYHLMPGLPGSNLKKDLNLFKKIFEDENFKPDQLKIYPCQVMPNSKLEEDYFSGNYRPYSKEEIQKLISQMIKETPRYCRIMRIMREIPPEYMTAGTKRIDLRKDIEEELREREEKGKKIEEIRFREIGFALRDLKKGQKINKEIKMKITEYLSSQGKEYFLEFVNQNDILFGLLRLRIYDNKAIVRELHVYGKALKLHEREKSGTQHTGLGKKLLEKAEEIAKENKCKNIRVISGVGVREYYRKLGYRLESLNKGEYMVKNL